MSSTAGITLTVAKGPDGKKHLNVDTMRAIRLARIHMLKRFQFFGQLASQMDVVVVEPDHPFLRTAATDGTRLYINPLFLELIGLDGAAFVVAHEVLHNVLLSFDRVGTREWQVWNQATDYAINVILVDSGFKMPTAGKIQDTLAQMEKMLGVVFSEQTTQVIASSNRATDPGQVIGLLDNKYRSWLAEHIYTDLLKNPPPSGSKEGEGGMPGPRRPSGTLDQHVRDGVDAPGYTKIGGKPSGKDQDRLARQWKQRANEAKVSCGGSMSRGLKELMDELNDPKISWRDILSMKMDIPTRSRYSWNPPNPRHFGRGITLPHPRRTKVLRRIISIDSSGSVSRDMLLDFFSETVGIASQYENWELLVLCHDGAVHNPQIYTSRDPSAIFDYEVQGRGGTHFGPVFKYLNREQPLVAGDDSTLCDFDCRDIVWFTDGGSGDGFHPQYASDFDVIWLVAGNPTLEVEWGLTLHYDKFA